jgi:hypothetical protein
MLVTLLPHTALEALLLVRNDPNYPVVGGSAPNPADKLLDIKANILKAELMLCNDPDDSDFSLPIDSWVNLAPQRNMIPDNWDDGKQMIVFEAEERRVFR